MKVSVIVPIYKVENYLNKCVDSIVNQTYKDLEIILVDDGSPDNCPKICDELAKTDERIIVIHKKNGGVSSARNAGIDVAKGDYIYFCDPDDFMQLDAIEKMLKAIENYDLVICGYNSISNNKITEVNLQDFVSLTNQEVFNYLVHGWFGTLWNKFYKKDLIKVKFNENCKWVEDLPFNIEYFKNVKTFGIIPEPVYNYIRLRKGSLTANMKEISFEEVLDCHEQMLKCLQDKNWISSIPHENASFLRGYINILKPYVNKKFTKNDKQLILNYLNQDITKNAFKNYIAISLKEKIFIKLLKGHHFKTLILLIKFMQKG